ncbi:hypothetical protein H0H81_005425, partial [Sphagnurus paluster]
RLFYFQEQTKKSPPHQARFCGRRASKRRPQILCMKIHQNLARAPRIIRVKTRQRKMYQLRRARLLPPPLRESRLSHLYLGIVFNLISLST